MNLLEKLMVSHHQILLSLAIAEAILMRTSAEQVPSLHRVPPRYFKLVTPSNFWPFMLLISTHVVCAVSHDFALFCADSHSICRCSVYESVGEVLKFTISFTSSIP